MTINVNFLYGTIAAAILCIFYLRLPNQRLPPNRQICLRMKEKIYGMTPDICAAYMLKLKKQLRLLYRTKRADYQIRPYLAAARNLICGAAAIEDASNAELFAELMTALDSIPTDENATLIPLEKVHELMHELSEHGYTREKTYQEYAGEPESMEYFAGDREPLYDITDLDIRTSSTALGPRGPSFTELSPAAAADDWADETLLGEEETPIYQIKDVQTPKIDKKNLISQNFSCSADYILTQKSSQVYSPICDINELRENREKLLAQTTDQRFYRGLRNDYDYLDM